MAERNIMRKLKNVLFKQTMQAFEMYKMMENGHPDDLCTAGKECRDKYLELESVIDNADLEKQFERYLMNTDHKLWEQYKETVIIL